MSSSSADGARGSLADPGCHPVDADLGVLALQLRQLLQAVHRWRPPGVGGTTDGDNGTSPLYADTPLLRRAAQRYHACWLPLLHLATASSGLAALATGCAQDLSHPPLDVAWVWLLHRLAPAAYRRFCLREYSCIIDPPVPSQAFAFGTTTFPADEMAAQRTRQCWEARWPHEPYELLVAASPSPAGLCAEVHIPVHTLVPRTSRKLIPSSHEHGKSLTRYDTRCATRLSCLQNSRRLPHGRLEHNRVREFSLPFCVSVAPPTCHSTYNIHQNKINVPLRPEPQSL
jgi:hypothetical protein